MRPEPLFTRKGDLRNLFEERLQLVKHELGRLDPPETHDDVDAMAGALFVRYRIAAPVLFEDKRYVHRQNELHLDVSHDAGGFVLHKNEPFYHHQAAITLAVPFEGERECFHHRPAAIVKQIPSGKIVGQELWLMYDIGEHNIEWLKKVSLAELSLIQQWLDNVRKELQRYNSALRLFMHQTLAETLKP
ncbi:MAG: hypothetical protein V1913_17900 [Fibrobacterota bacterium]